MTDQSAAEDAGHPTRRFWPLVLGSIGVVYGDIGTSPLYAMRESLLHLGDVPTPEEIIGIVSLLVRSLVLVVTLKYVALILRADNRGEGGALALMSLAQTALAKRSTVVLGLGIAGAGLFYGDAILTPAISVLSAVEGLKTVSPGVQPYVIPIALTVIVGLYVVQSFGTAKVASLFSPIMVVWFLVIAAVGVSHIGNAPEILYALNPAHALGFLFGHGLLGFAVLGSVFLAVTGAEALYADMGHFGRNPIRMAWLGFVCPSLVLNYVGQGAFALAEPAAIQDLFFLSAPEWARLPMVVLATLATIIAGQAVITGAYSLTRQAMQLGLLPYLEVQQTSESEHGQIYLPKINWLMLAGVVTLVLLFGSSSRLASAYGVAVTGTMIVTSLLAVVVLARSWRWGVPLALLVVAPFLVIDGAFLVANLLKLPDGGYVPLLFGAVIMLLMWTWIRGTRIVSEKVRRDSAPLAAFIRSIESSDVVRVPGTAMFLTSNPHNAPAALLHNLKHNKVVHESNVLVTVRTASQPYVADAERITLTKVATGFSTLEISYGFMEDPTLLRALKKARGEGLKFDIMGTSFFLGRRQIRQAAKGGMPSWQDALFIRMMRQSHDTTEYYRIPPDRVVELGTHVTI